MRIVHSSRILLTVLMTGLSISPALGQDSPEPTAPDLRSAANPIDPKAAMEWLVPDDRLRLPAEKQIPIVFVTRNQEFALWESLKEFWNPSEQQVIDPITETTYTQKVIRIKVPLGLTQAPSVPAENPLTLHSWILGKKLYYDEILSSDLTIACASCHAPDKGFTDQRPTSLGIHEQFGGMNAPTVINAGLNRFQFWDGRAISLEDQAQGPVQNPLEMFSTKTEDVPWDSAVVRIRKNPRYVTLFEQVYGHAPTRDAAAKAIANYERTVLVGNALVDRAEVAMRERCEDEGDFSFKYKPEDFEAVIKEAVTKNDARALDAIDFEMGKEKEFGQRLYNGRELFFGKANCNTCHAGDNFTDNLFHNLGVGVKDGNITAADLGRFGAEPIGHKNPSDIGAFKTPTLRALLDTKPYMHDGSEDTLEKVIDFYDKGGNANEFLDVNMRDLVAEARYKAAIAAGEKYEGPDVVLCGPKKVPIVPKKLNLSDQEKADLVLFMKALQGDAVPAIVADPKLIPEIE